MLEKPLRRHPAKYWADYNIPSSSMRLIRTHGKQNKQIVTNIINYHHDYSTEHKLYYYR